MADVIFEFDDKEHAKGAFCRVFRKFASRDCRHLSFVTVSETPPLFIVACSAQSEIRPYIAQTLSDFLGRYSARNREQVLTEPALARLIDTDETSVRAL